MRAEELKKMTQDAEWDQIVRRMRIDAGNKYGGSELYIYDILNIKKLKELGYQVTEQEKDKVYQIIWDERYTVNIWYE